MFQPFPAEIYFQNFEPFKTYEVPLVFRNSDKVVITICNFMWCYYTLGYKHVNGECDCNVTFSYFRVNYNEHFYYYFEQ